MKRMKRILALSLTVLLLVACLPITGVLAAGTPTEWEDGDISIPIIPVQPTPPQPDEPITDLNGSGKTDTDDAVYLLLSVMFGEGDYPLPVGANTDYDGSGKVNTNDAVYLLLHVMFGDVDYPLYPTAA